MNVFGQMWNGIVAGLNWLLQAIYGMTGNYGVAIILLTILVKVVLLPLTIKQTRSMIAMQKVQPEIKKLQEKYKEDKEKLSQEMMKFYKENKVNPLGGCLPLLLQLPIFFALFIVLRKYLLTPPAIIVGQTYTIFPGYASISGYAALPGLIKSASFLWINNLADSTRIADPTYILIIILAVSTWYSQKQVMTDPRQKNMMLIMPLITAFIGISLPAGVVLYWMTTNILQIVQQWAMEYYDKKHPKEEPKTAGKNKAPPERAAAKAKGKTGEGAASRAKSGREPPKSAGKARVSPKAGAQKQKPRSGGTTAQKGKGSGRQKSTPPKGGKTPSQTRKPKGPPPQQKKAQKSTAKKGGARNK